MSTTTESARTAVEDSLWAVISTDPQPAAELATAAGISQSKTRKILNMWAADGSISRHSDDTNPRAAARWSIAPTDPGTDTAISDDEGSDDPEDSPRTTDIIEPDLNDTTPPLDTDDTSDTLSTAPSTDTDITQAGDTNPAPTDPDGTHSTGPTPPPEATAPGADTDSSAEPADTPVPEPAEEAGTETTPDQGKLAPGALRGLVEDHLRDHPEQEFTPHQIGKALGGRSSGAVHNALVRLTDTGVAQMTTNRPKKFTLAPPTES